MHTGETIKVMVLMPFEEEGKRRLEAAGGGKCEFQYGFDEDFLQNTEVLIGGTPADAYRLTPLTKLRWVQLSWAGTEPYSLPGVLPAGTVLTNATGAFGHAIGEHMVACVTMLQKKLHLYRDNMAVPCWLDRGNVKSIEGSVVLTLGLGDIGCNFARRMKGLGAYNIGVRRVGTDKPDYVDELYLSDRIDELLPRADVVAMTLPNTRETYRILSRERIFSMKKGAILINVGRGNAVDPDALCEALNSGHLDGASLDVTDPEPLPADHPLWRCENALITPHISGFYHLRATYDNIIGICIDNLSRYVEGRPLCNVVDFETGYRSPSSPQSHAAVN